MTPFLITIIALALIFDYINGFHDAANSIATIVSTKVLTPFQAVLWAAVFNSVAFFIFKDHGVADTVAKTVKPDHIEGNMMVVIFSGLIAAITWNLLTWWLGMPSSSSHALIGGLVGAVVAGIGWNVIKISGIEKILLTLFTSPIIGLVFGFLVARLILLLCWNASPRVNWIFKKGQIFTAVALALSHGTNDAQKSMGIITLGLVTSGVLKSFEVPIWVIFACASMIALGTSVGGWKLIKTLGAKFYRIRPMDGFAAQITSASVILGASLIGGPVSTTQVVSTAIMGVGSADRANKVRWGVAGEILTAWLLTIPATALLGAGIHWLISTLNLF